MSNNHLINSQNNLQSANELLNYVIEKLNIKSESDLVLADIVQDLSTVKNLNQFRIYIKENQRRSEFNYLTGVQKFDAMFNVFKEKEKIIKEDSITKKCNEIIEKLRRSSRAIDKAIVKIDDTIDYIKNAKYVNLKVDNQCLFNPQEQKLLNEVGSLGFCLNNFSKNDFFNKLFNAYTRLSNIYLIQKKDSFIPLEDLRSKASMV